MTEYLINKEVDFTIDEKCFLLAYIAEDKNMTSFTSFERTWYRIYYNVAYNNEVETVDIVLKLIKKLKLDLWSMFKENIPRDFDFSHSCLLNSPEAFIRITEAGASNGITKIGSLYHCYFIKLFFDEFYDMETQIQNDTSRYPLNFRVYQLLNLCARYKGKSARLEMPMRVLWSSIPDPLLTSTDVFRLFEGIDPIYFPKINNICQWYCNLVNSEETSVRRPRSLQHLSRYCIRNRLRDNFKLPEGVEELGIPKLVQKYLLLRDFNKIE
ncbi:uncharacterized protein [Parasteatoda tepidariorum]|uniref:uncharacterized protein n=1 Tax=Parasteatoda tepidariorum TaxID=114398 RepID=UPI001C71992C|nr:uncharacterized protein LOC122270336 [Parasteatoda tepidariorum]